MTVADNIGVRFHAATLSLHYLHRGETAARSASYPLLYPRLKYRKHKVFILFGALEPMEFYFSFPYTPT